MKTFTLFLLSFFLLSLQLSATVFTVNNTPGSNAQFQQLQPAHDAASPGDTLFVSGSSIQYGSINVLKKITIIGPGLKPSNTDFKTVVLELIELQKSESSGSVFMGISFSGIRSFELVNNIKLIRCKIGAAEIRDGQNWEISGCIGGRISGNGVADNFAVIKNNIFSGGVNSVKNSSILNNVFTTNSGISYVKNVIVANNIFYNTYSIITSSSIFNNNIFFSTLSSDFYTNDDPYGDTNSLSGNFIGVNPQFVNVTSYSFNFDFDYSLAETSVGKNAGTDGTDIGVFGGAGFSTTGEPSLPIVTTLLIKNASVEQNGELQVEIKGRANN